MPFLIIIINIFIGLVFLVSALLKLYPIEYFELKIEDLPVINYKMSLFLSRLTIGMEFLIALLFLVQLNFNKRLYKFTLVLLLIFIAYNLIDLIVRGNNSNCGCFGVFIDMTPLVSIIKNVILCIILIFAIRISHPPSPKLRKIVFPILFLVCISLPFILNPVTFNPLNNSEDMKGQKLNLDFIEKHEGVKGKTFSEDLQKGKRLVAFLSLKCTYCKVAATKLGLVKKEHTQLPIYFILNGDSSDLPSFNRVTLSSHVPAVHFNGGEDFLKIGGYQLPSIYWVENEVIFRKDNYTSFNLIDFNKWLNSK